MLTKEEILNKIDELTFWVIRHADPTKFVLNDALEEYETRLKEIQKECPHEFDETGYCLYCGKDKNS